MIFKAERLRTNNVLTTLVRQRYFLSISVLYHGMRLLPLMFCIELGLLGCGCQDVAEEENGTRTRIKSQSNDVSWSLFVATLCV